jgi:hypothetical protein
MDSLYNREKLEVIVAELKEFCALIVKKKIELPYNKARYSELLSKYEKIGNRLETYTLVNYHRVYSTDKKDPDSYISNTSIEAFEILPGYVITQISDYLLAELKSQYDFKENYLKAIKENLELKAKLEEQSKIVPLRKIKNE